MQVLAEVQVVNPDGLHTRPAAAIADAMAGFDAKLTVANTRTGADPRALAGPISVMLLDAKLGDRIAVTAEGPQAQAAIDALSALVSGGFGEL